MGTRQWLPGLLRKALMLFGCSPNLRCLEKGPGFSYASEMAPQLRECLGKPEVDVKNF